MKQVLICICVYLHPLKVSYGRRDKDREDADLYKHSILDLNQKDGRNKHV